MKLHANVDSISLWFDRMVYVCLDSLGYFSYRYNLPLTIRSARFSGTELMGQLAIVWIQPWDNFWYCDHLRDWRGTAGLHVLLGLPENIWMQFALLQSVLVLFQ